VKLSILNIHRGRNIVRLNELPLDSMRFEKIWALGPNNRCRFRWWSPLAYWYFVRALWLGYRPRMGGPGMRHH
jgi:hypothetical protein